MLKKIDEWTWIAGFGLLTIMMLAVWIPGILIIGYLEKFGLVKNEC